MFLTIDRFLKISACAVLILALAACTTPTAVPASATPTPAPATSTAVSLPATATTAATATAAASPTTPAIPTTAASPSAPAVTSTANTPAGVITAENAASLSPTPLTLPEWPQNLVWPGAGVPLPAGITTAPDLLGIASSEGNANVYPIQLNPPSVGPKAQLAVPANVMAYAPDGSSLAAKAENAPLTLFDLSGKLLQKLDEPDAYGASYSRDGKLLAVAQQSQIAVDIIDLATGQRTTRLTGFETAAPVYGAGIVPGNKTIYWISRATLVFQDIQSGQMGQKLSFTDFIIGTVFTPDGSHMILNVEGKLMLYSVPDAQKQGEITLSQPASSLSLSPDGKLLAAGYGTGIQLWDAATLAPVTTLPGPGTSTSQVAFSPDGKYLITLHENNLLQVWQPK